MSIHDLDEALKRVQQYSKSTQAKQSLEECHNHLNENAKRIYEKQQPSAEDMRNKFTV